jgi:hypothetical protein
MSGKSLLAIVLVAAVMAVGHRSCLAGEGDPGKPASGKPAAAKPLRPKITISRETTYLTGPLRPDGYVDYVAAINECCSKGVTPDINGAVPLIQAFGPGEIDKDLRERFFKMLGIAPLPPEGKYFIDFREIAKRKAGKPREGKAAFPKTPAELKAAHDQTPESESEVSILEKWYHAMERPWSKEEFPLVATWLEKNRMQIDLIVEGAHRTRFYVPMVCTGEPELTKALGWPMMHIVRAAGDTLRTRAMLNVKAGKVDEAWADLLACHRLARLLSQRPTVVDHLAARSIERFAQESDIALVSSGHLSAERAKRFGDELRSLPPMVPLADSINNAERYLDLEFVLRVARDGPIAVLRSLFGDPNGTVAPKPEGPTPLDDPVWTRPVDWDEPLRIGNSRFDRIYEAFTKPTPTQRRAAIEQLERDRMRMGSEAEDPKWKAENLFAARSAPVAAGRQIGRRLVAWFTPDDWSSCATAEDRATAYRRMDELLFALVAYRAEQDEYPAELAKICPKYLQSLPDDPFGTGPIRYKREPEGYVLYSVGPNGKDDGGHNWSFESNSDEPENQQRKIPHDADDFFIRLPPRSR